MKINYWFKLLMLEDALYQTDHKGSPGTFLTNSSSQCWSSLPFHSFPFKLLPESKMLWFSKYFSHYFELISTQHDNRSSCMLCKHLIKINLIYFHNKKGSHTRETFCRLWSVLQTKEKINKTRHFCRLCMTHLSHSQIRNTTHRTEEEQQRRRR